MSRTRRLVIGLAGLVIIAATGGWLITSVWTDDNSGDIGRDAYIAQQDAKALARSLDDLVVAREPVVVRKCQNHGSGPIPPTTKIDLALRGDTSIRDVQAETKAALRERGYEVTETPDDEPRLLFGWRPVAKGRWTEVSLYESPSSDGDLVIGTSLIPAITC